MGSTRPVLVIAYPGAELLDIACPSDVFDAANRIGVERRYDLELASVDGDLRCQNGILLHARKLAEMDGPLDTLIVAGGVGHEAAAGDPRLLAQVRRLAGRSRRVASVCTGVTVLARAGLLAGRRVTTHWKYADKLVADHPELVVDPKPLYIKDGLVYTSAGVTSGLDLALSMVDEDNGPTVARLAARALVAYVQRPGDQAQISMFLAGRPAEHRVLADLTTHIANRPACDLSTPVLATRAGVGGRQLTRLFWSQLGTTPGRYVRSVRAETAAQLLSTALPLATVAKRSGFGSTAAMRRAFTERFDATPSDYRKGLRRSVRPELYPDAALVKRSLSDPSRRRGRLPDVRNHASQDKGVTMTSSKWKIAIVATATIAAAGGATAWAAADGVDTKASDHVDGLDKVTDDWNDHADELGGPLCDGCDHSDNTDLVVLWQSVLVTDGFLVTENPIDGYFGPDTKRATAMWQDHFGVEQTGKVDDATWTEASLHLSRTDSTVYYASEGEAEIRFTRHNDSGGAYTLNKLLPPDGGELINQGGDRIEHYERTIELTAV